MRIAFLLMTIALFLGACSDGSEGQDNFGEDDATAARDTFPPLNEEALRNARYMVTSGTGEATVIELVDGFYEADTAPGAEAPPVYELLEPHAIGDLNEDGSEDAAVLLSSSFGGSGVFVDLQAVLNKSGLPDNVARYELGDRVQVDDLTIQEGVIEVSMVTHGPGDPACCPSQKIARRFVLQDERLVPVGGGESPATDADSTAVPV